MSKQELPHAPFSQHGKASRKGSDQRSRLANLIERTHTLNFFYKVAGSVQILLGISVITIAVIGLIRPLWLSKVFIMMASLSTLTGGYLLYTAKSKNNDSRTLLHKAMQRMMKSKN